MILAYLANTFRIFVCFHSDKNIQAIMLVCLSWAHHLCSRRPQDWQGLPRGQITSSQAVLGTCPAQPSVLSLMVPHSCLPTTQQAVEIPKKTKCSSQLGESVDKCRSHLTYLFCPQFVALFLYLEVFYHIHCFVIKIRVFSSSHKSQRSWIPIKS